MGKFLLLLLVAFVVCLCFAHWLTTTTRRRRRKSNCIIITVLLRLNNNNKQQIESRWLVYILLAFVRVSREKQKWAKVWVSGACNTHTRTHRERRQPSHTAHFSLIDHAHRVSQRATQKKRMIDAINSSVRVGLQWARATNFRLSFLFLSHSLSLSFSLSVAQLELISPASEKRLCRRRQKKKREFKLSKQRTLCL